MGRTSANKLLPLLLAAAAAFAPAGAHAGCGLSLTVSNINLVWTATLPTQQLTFTVKKSGGSACTYFITFSKGGAADYNRRMVSGASQLSYQLYQDASLTNVLKDQPDATGTNDVVTGSFSNGSNQTQTNTFYLAIPYAQATTPTLKPQGTYTDTFVMKIFDRATATTPDATANVQLSTQIARNVQLSLVSSGASFDAADTTETLNFGTLVEGATRGFDLRVLTNAGYSVTFSSQNNGVLKHAAAGVSTTVPYTLTVNNVAKNLAGSATSPVAVASGSGQTTTSGVANPVAVTIGSVSDKMAGSYSDNITVTATTTE